MNYIKDVELFTKEKCDWYNVIIEIPKGTNSKYELREPLNDEVLEVRKVIGKYPFYYGCFPRTYAGDKDPLDMIFITTNKYKILDTPSVVLYGMIKTIDNGEIDNKIIVVDKLELPFLNMKKELKKALKFLHSYKGKKADMKIDDTIYGYEEAEKYLSQCAFNYRQLNQPIGIKSM